MGNAGSTHWAWIDSSAKDLRIRKSLTNEVLYGAIEKVSTKIRRRRSKFAGHCLHRDDEVVSDLVPWNQLMELEDGEGHRKATLGLWSAILVYRRAR